jgi:alpha-L-fucosidase
MNHPGFRDTSRPSDENWQGQPERPEWPLYLDYMELQVRELLLRYGDIFVIWFDGLANQAKYDGWRFHKVIREIQPRALINNRIGLPGDYSTPEQRTPKGIPVKSALMGGTNPNDQGLSASPPKPEDFRQWETCMTINRTWGYNKNDRNFKSTTELIRTLIDVASKGGNFLLNVGPTPKGTIQPEFQERLLAIGEWLKVNGESIYGSTYGPLQDVSFGRTTAKGNVVYLHIFDWPGPKAELNGLNARVTKAWMLAGNRPVPFRQQGGRLTLQLPEKASDPHASVIGLTIK